MIKITLINSRWNKISLIMMKTYNQEILILNININEIVLNYI